MEIVFSDQDRRCRTLLMSVEIIRIEGQLYSLAMSIDFTQRKEVELVNQQSLSRLQATLESTADGILVVDLAGRIVDFNRQFAEV